MKIIQQFQTHFAGRVIRRTHTSVDFAGNVIFELEPYQEHLLVLELDDVEMAALEKQAEEVVARNNRLTGLDVSADFSITDVRQCCRSHYRRPVSLCVFVR